MKGFFIESVVAYGKGFMVGGDFMTIYIYEPSADSNICYDRTKVLSVIEYIN